MSYIFGKLRHLAIIWAIRKSFQCILQGVTFLLANQTRLSPTSENESYQIEMKSFLTLVHSSNFSKRPIIDGIPQSRQNTHFEFQTSSLEEALSILKYFRLIFWYYEILRNYYYLLETCLYNCRKIELFGLLKVENLRVKAIYYWMMLKLFVI